MLSRDHHEIAAIQVDANAPDSHAGGVGLSHVAFRLRDEAHLHAAYADLKKHQIEIVSAVNHGVTKSVYFRDSDGYQQPIANANTRSTITAMWALPRGSEKARKSWRSDASADASGRLLAMRSSSACNSAWSRETSKILATR